MLSKISFYLNISVYYYVTILVELVSKTKNIFTFNSFTLKH